MKRKILFILGVLAMLLSPLIMWGYDNLNDFISTQNEEQIEEEKSHNSLEFDNNSVVESTNMRWNTSAVTPSYPARVKDSRGTYWDVTVEEEDAPATLTYVSGPTNCYIPQGHWVEAYDYNNGWFVNFWLEWNGNGLGSVVVLNSNCTAYLTSDTPATDIKGTSKINTNQTFTIEYVHPCEKYGHSDTPFLELPADCTNPAQTACHMICEWCGENYTDEYTTSGSALGHNNTVTGVTGTKYIGTTTKANSFSYTTCSRDGWTVSDGIFTSHDFGGPDKYSDFTVIWESIIEFEFNASGNSTLTFSYRVCSESCDNLIVYLDDTQKFIYDGEEDATYKTCTISNISGGDHVLRLEYTKDGSVDEYEDRAQIKNLEIRHTHSFVQGALLYDATCDVPAIYNYQCTCGSSYEQEVGSPLGHINTADNTFGVFTYVTCMRSNCGWKKNDDDSFTSNNYNVKDSNASITFTFTVTSLSKITFDYSVSSEGGCDDLYIYLDGTAKGYYGLEDGEIDSGTITYDNLAIGTHTLKFTYSKDSSVNRGTDEAQISNLKLESMQVAGYVTLTATSGSVEYGTTSTTFTVNSNHGGKLVPTDNNNTATVSGSTTITIANIGTLDAGTTIVVTVTCEQTTKYKEATATYTLTIVRKKISIPTSPADKVYNGSAQAHGISIPTGASIVTASSTTSATNAATYNVVFQVGSNYQWSDSTIENKTVPWKIVKAKGYVTLTETSGSVEYGTTYARFFISSDNHGGTLSVFDDNSTATVNNTTHANTVNIENIGSLAAGVCVTITVKCASTTNYTEATATYELTITKKSLAVPNSPSDKTYSGSTQAHGITIPTGASIVAASSTTSAKDANTYNVVLQVGSNYQWKLSNGTTTTNNQTVSWTIAPKKITVVLTPPTNAKYNGTEQCVLVAVNGIVNNDAYELAKSGTWAATDAGSYTASVTGISNTNYTVDATSIDWSIGNGSLEGSYVVTHYNAQYDGLYHSISVTTSKENAIISYSDSETGTYTTSIDAHSYKNYTNGAKTVWYKITCPNYDTVVASSTVTITQRTLNITVTPNKFEPTYTGSPIAFTNGFTPTYDRLIDGDIIEISDANADYTYSDSETEPTNVGTYIIKMSGLSGANANYEISFTYNPGTMIIKKYQVAIPQAITSQITYDGVEHEYIPTAYDSSYCNIENNEYKDAGYYNAVVTLKDTANYEWTDSTNGSRQFAFTVHKKDLNLTITVASNSHVYTGSNGYVKGFTPLNTTPFVGTDTLEDSISIDKLNVSYYTIVNGTRYNIVDMSNVNVYDVYIDGLVISSTNYNVIENYVSGTYTITNAELYNLSYTADESKVYDGLEHRREVTAESVNGQKITYSYSVTPSRTNAGTTAVTCTMTAPNHNPKEVTYNVIVTKKTVSIVVTPSGQEETYSGSLEYTNGDKYKITSVETLVSSDLAQVVDGDYSKFIVLAGEPTYTFAGSTTLNQNVGSYAISMSGLTASAENYHIETINYGIAYFVIKEAELEVTANGYSGIYDGEYHSGTVTVTTKASMAEKVYYSTVSMADAKSETNQNNPRFRNVNLVNLVVTAYTVYYYVVAPNHAPVEGIFSVTITPKALAVTIKPNDYEVTYSNNVVYPGGYAITSIDGLVGGDTAEVVKYSGTAVYKFGNNATGFSTTLNQNANEAGYEIEMSNVELSADNYNISVTNAKGLLKIYKKDIALAEASFTPDKVVYNGSAQKLEPNVYINLVSGNSDVLLTKNNDYTLGYDDAVNAGIVTVTITGAGNYKGSTEAIYEITKAEMGEHASELNIKEMKILTVEGNQVRLTKLSDIDLTKDLTAGYGYWMFDGSYDLDEAIYTTSRKYSYEFNMVFKSTNENYNDAYGTLTVSLKKNTIEFTLLTAVEETYDMQAIEEPVYEIAYDNAAYNGEAKVQYYKGGSEIEYVPTNAGTYQYRVIVEETEYYNYAESNLTAIVIKTKNINELEYSEVLDETYTGKAIAPEVEVRYGSYELTSEDITVTYANNVDAITKSSVRATITITGKGNYTEAKVIEFTINPKEITEEMISEIEDVEYNEAAQTPALEIIDGQREAVLILSNDYEAEYTNNTNVGTAKVSVTGIKNYTGNVEVEFEILHGTLPGNRIPTVGVLNGRVDELLTALTGQLAGYNGNYGVWKFWDNENNCEYPTDKVVATEVGNGTVTYGLMFDPTDDNYNNVYDREVVIIVNLNDSRVEFVNENIEFVYTAQKVTFTNADIEKIDNAEEFENDVIRFYYYAEDNTSITAPTNVGTYKVEAVVAANRKYKEARATVEFKITPRDIADVDVELTNVEANEADYQYTTKGIEPLIKATYGAETLNSKNTDYTLSYRNNVELSTALTKAEVILTGSGNYTGSKTVYFNVVARDLATLEIEAIADQFYNGAALTPQVTMFNNATLLLVDEDFTVVYQDNNKVGTAVITVTGKNNYTGSNQVRFVIYMKPIDSALLPEVDNQIAVVGTLLNTIELPENENGSWSFVVLEENENATVGNVSATGNKFEIVFTPTGDYSKTYSTMSIIVIRRTPNLVITNSTLNKEYNTLADSVPNYEYDGDGLVTTTYYKDGQVLTGCPKDAGSYTVVVNAPQTDTCNEATAQMSFVISKAIIGGENVEVMLTNPQIYDNGNQIVPAVTIKHTNVEATLVKDTDYSVIAGANNTVGVNAGVVYIVAMGNYATEKSFFEIKFDITEDGDDVVDEEGKEVVITILDIQAQVYTGVEIKPTLTIQADGVLLTADHYDAVYTNNVDVTNQALVTVTFKNGYSGEKTKTFTINPLELDPAYVYVSDTTVGSNPVVEVKREETVLVLDTDYTVQFSSTNEEAGEATATVYGKGNYTGEVVKTYTIKNEEPSIFTINNSIYKFYLYTKQGRAYKWVENTHTAYNANEDLLLRHVADNQVLSVFLAQFANSTDRIRVTTAAGRVIDSTKYARTYVSNGSVFELLDADGNVIDKFTVIVAGDVNNDGKINQRDKMSAFAYVAGDEDYTAYQKYALDINGDAKFNSNDSNYYDAHLAGTDYINDGLLIA